MYNVFLDTKLDTIYMSYTLTSLAQFVDNNIVRSLIVRINNLIYNIVPVCSKFDRFNNCRI